MPNIPISVYWTVIIIILVILEVLTMNLVAIWFAASALVGLILSLLNFSLMIQIVAFLIISAILLFYTKPFVKKYLKVGIHKTNVDSVIGKNGIVIKPIKKYTSGLVKINGQTWTAISFNDEAIDKDEEVIIMAVEGVKLIVKRSD